MKVPMTIVADDAAAAWFAVPAPSEEEAGDSCLEQIYLIETGSGPRVETALLRDVLARSPGMGKDLADPAEVHNYHHPLAAVNSFKHRLHALRCENVNLRLRIQELEIQLSQMRVLENQLNNMLNSRGWRLLEKYRGWRRTVLRWLRIDQDPG